MTRRTVPVAYITKWATTRGIVVVRDAECHEDGCLRKMSGGWLTLSIGPSEWTEDRAEAETRWHNAMRKAQIAAQRKAATLEDVIHAGPKWEGA